MGEHVPAHAQMEEEQLAKPMNTPVVLASQPIGKDHCNDLGNKEIRISIITKKLYLYKLYWFLLMYL